jgi:hypothetical protein
VLLESSLLLLVHEFPRSPLAISAEPAVPLFPGTAPLRMTQRPNVIDKRVKSGAYRYEFDLDPGP